MSAAKQENDHRKFCFMKLDYQHNQESFEKDYSDVFFMPVVLTDSRKSNFEFWILNFDRIIKTCNGISKTKWENGSLIECYIVVL